MQLNCAELEFLYWHQQVVVHFFHRKFQEKFLNVHAKPENAHFL
jgi:hypothetical protein